MNTVTMPLDAWTALLRLYNACHSYAADPRVASLDIVGLRTGEARDALVVARRWINDAEPHPEAREIAMRLLDEHAAMLTARL